MSSFRGRLHHQVPSWVPDGEFFHIRVRASWRQPMSLTSPVLSAALIESARQYHNNGRWLCRLFLIMPDHLHAILSFPREAGMSETIRNWKRGATRFHGIEWQHGFFDHRLRSPTEVGNKWWYIRDNPVVKGLVAHEDDWPHWWCPHLHESEQ